MRVQGRGRHISKNRGIDTESKPVLIGIGGSHSNVGKTFVAAALLKHLAHGDRKDSWGAIKYTKTAVYASIVDDPSIICQKDKDTERLTSAGAENVLWVQCPPERLNETLPLAVSRLSHLNGIIIEGNSAIEFLKPDIVIFIFGKAAGTKKKSSEKVLEMAHIVLFQDAQLGQMPAGAKKINIDLESLSGFDEVIKSVEELLK